MLIDSLKHMFLMNFNPLRMGPFCIDLGGHLLAVGLQRVKKWKISYILTMNSNICLDSRDTISSALYDFEKDFCKSLEILNKCFGEKIKVEVRWNTSCS